MAARSSPFRGASARLSSPPPARYRSGAVPLHLHIGGAILALDAPPPVAAALSARFAAFLGPAGPADAWLVVEPAAAGFDPGFALDPRLPPDLAVAAEGDRVALRGAARGELELATGHGRLHEARHFGQVDALVRLALSLRLPARGALLLHGAAVATGEGVLVLVGDSGAGKSTAAAALGQPLCDELVVLRPGDAGLSAWGTPYWNGLPRSGPVRAVACLSRASAAPTGLPLAGAGALRALSAHVVRYLAHPAVDRLTLPLLAAACRGAPLYDLRCPTGPDFLPFLRAQLALR
jgi:hypothetical protein